MDIPSNFLTLLRDQWLGFFVPGSANGVDGERDLVPSFDSPRRTASLFVSILHLTGSLLGGGVFLVPTLFARCRKLDIVLLVVSTSILVNVALYLTIAVVRASRLFSYTELVSNLLGDEGHFVLSVVLFIFLSMVMVAYFSLMICIWVPVTQAFLPNRLLALPIAFGCTLLLFSPLLCRRDFRFNPAFAIPAALSLLSFLTVSSNTQTSASRDGDISKSYHRMLLVALPIIAMNLFSNQVIQMHAKLQRPTLARVAVVIRASVAVAALFTIGFGWSVSKKFAGSDFWLEITNPVQGALYLEHYKQKSTLEFIVLLFGFGACVCTVLIASATILPQYRRTVLYFVSYFCISPDNPDQCRRVKELCPEECCDEDEDDMDDQQTCVSFRSLSTWSTKSHVDVYQVANEETQLLPRIEEGLEPCNIYTNTFAHFASTAGIIVIVYGLAMLAYFRGISAWAIWCLAGTFFAPSLSFAVPALCFIQNSKRNTQGHVIWSMGAHAWLLLMVAVFLTVVPTVEVLRGFLDGEITDLLIRKPFT